MKLINNEYGVSYIKYLKNINIFYLNMNLAIRCFMCFLIVKKRNEKKGIAIDR